MTLKLLKLLYKRKYEHILHNLVIRNLAGRGYYDDSCQECISNQETVTIETTQGNSVNSNSVKSVGHSNVQSNTCHASETDELPNESQPICDNSDTADSKNINSDGSCPITHEIDSTREG